MAGSAYSYPEAAGAGLKGDGWSLPAFLLFILYYLYAGSQKQLR
jgi:hypothetical protein